MSEGLSKRQA